MIKIILSDESIDSVRSVAPAKEVPYKMWLSDETEKMRKVYRWQQNNEIKAAYGLSKGML